MALFELTLILLLAAVALTALSRRLEIPYPSLLALAGVAIAFVPGAPTIEIDPELALALFIAPVLLDAAYDTSLRDLKRYRLSLALLALGAVVFTTVVVALVGWKMAGLPIAAAIALGAIVAPPDAVAASAVLSQFKVPHRITAILQGESLLNDATALLIYRLAVSAALGTIMLSNAVPVILLATIGSVIAGYLFGRVSLLSLGRIEDAASSTVVQFAGTFAVWIIADRLGLSAIITIVVYAMTIARRAPRQSSARRRVSTYSVWESAVFVLNVLAFVLMGLQARTIVGRLAGDGQGEAFLFAATVLVVVIVAPCLGGELRRDHPVACPLRQPRGKAGIADIRRRRHCRLVRHAWVGDAGGRHCAAGRFSRPRPDRACRLRGGAGHAGAARHDAEAAAALDQLRPR